MPVQFRRNIERFIPKLIEEDERDGNSPSDVSGTPITTCGDRTLRYSSNDHDVRELRPSRRPPSEGSRRI